MITEKSFQQKKKPVISPGISLIAGGVAGAVEATATVRLSPLALYSYQQPLECNFF
jgi:hypothetical protein